MDVWNIVIVVIDVLFITGALLWVKANNSRIEQRLKYLETNIDRLYTVTEKQTKLLKTLTDSVRAIANLNK